ncbi:MAG: sulfotransferase family 2 domain-containing protein [Proteobacteria bacterium]|nr:sulfotransferase family 2 domain-containing protein [Pseudomonadota bacterium]
MANMLRTLVEAMGLEGAEICLHGDPNVNPNENPLFFYHVHKTGGISVISCLLMGFWANEALRNPDRTIDELYRDATSHIGRWDTRSVNDAPHPPDDRPDGYSFVSSHHKFGHHELFKQNFRLFTMLRDPVERVISDYHYRVWRKHEGYESLSEEGFVSYIRDPDNVCMHSQHLSRLNLRKDGIERMGEDAMSNLQALDGYGTTDQWEDFVQSVWNNWDFPNYIGSRWLKTPRRECLNTDPFTEELIELNKYDIALYEYAKQNPRPLAAVSNGTNFRHHSIIVYDKDEDAGTFDDAQIIKTTDFLNRVKQGEKKLSDFAAPAA